MKKIIVLALGVLSSALVFAKGIDDPIAGSSSVTVLNSTGSNLFKVLYKARTQGTVKVSIVNDNHETVFSETFKHKDGFIRPYNFKDLSPGVYTIEVEDESGKQIERINYGINEPQPFIHLTRLSGEGSRYLLTGNFQKEETIQVRIYNADSEIVFDESRKVATQFGEVYNMRNLPGAFTIEVVDAQGIVKSIQH